MKEQMMHVFEQRVLGIGMLFLLAILVGIKHAATGSILKDKPENNPWLWFVHVFNLFFLLVVNPAAAVVLTIRRMEAVDPTLLSLSASWLRSALEIGGIGLYIMGFLLMGWALMSLRDNYQAGGSNPRACDEMVLAGPYALIRHPMYTGALCISLGLAFMVQSLILFTVFLIYLALILFMIPFEERRLILAYGESYRKYLKIKKKIIPYLY